MREPEIQIELAELYARKKHANQRYEPHPYTFHLEMVVMILKLHGYTDPDVIIGGWLHDVIEDQSIPKEALVEMFGMRAFKMIRAVTDPQGLPNRKTRKEKVYEKLKEFPEAIPIKLADRIANIMSSKFNNPKLFKMYTKEHIEFFEALYKPEHESMWDHIELLLEPQTGGVKN